MRCFPLGRESLRVTCFGFAAGGAGFYFFPEERRVLVHYERGEEKESVFDDLPQTENGDSWLCYTVSEDFFPWLEGEAPSP